VARFATLGFSHQRFRVHVFDLAEGYGIDGLVGLSFLDHLNYDPLRRERVPRRPSLTLAVAPVVSRGRQGRASTTSYATAGRRGR
jgi:hypothetical protein